MLGSLARRARLFLQSELDLQKDRIIAQLVEDLRRQRLFNADPSSAVAQLGWLVSGDTEKTHVTGLNFTFDHRTDFAFVAALELVAILVRDLDAKLRRLPDHRIEIQIGRIRVTPATAQEIGILVEVLRDEIYMVQSPEPMYVWDVGANVGIASMYFANVADWDVAAYELFPATAAAAHENIERSGLADRIKLVTAGVGARDGRLTLPYYTVSRGSNGLYRQEGEADAGTSSRAEVQVIDASAVISQVKAEAAGRPIFAKFDCEGAEYDIVARLEATGQLRLISAMVMELHALPGLEPGKVLSSLKTSGFLVHRPQRPAHDLSIIYATRLGAAPL